VLRRVLSPAVHYLSTLNWSLDMALNENANWELVAAQVARETDSEKLRELAAEFNRVLHKREQMRRQQDTKSV
jgi:hypothetical protein